MKADALSTYPSVKLAQEVTDLVNILRATLSGVIWIEGMLDRHVVIQLLSHATAFVCPSLYEPLGIVNLEAMACGTAVVASNVGGIPEVVAGRQTGLLVQPDKPQALADALNTLAHDQPRAEAMGYAGRQRAISEFDWTSIATQTAKLYHEVAESSVKPADA